jgi:nucleoside-diphosphate-sugar epimerase
VRALYRSAAKIRPFSSTGIEWVAGCLEDPASLARLVEGSDAIVHCAGVVRGISAADFRCVNVAGVAALAAIAANLHPAPRFLLISSLAARAPALSHYAASKRAGEAALTAAASGMAWTVFRPPVVYGPGDRELLPLLRSMQRGLIPLLAPDEARFSLVYVNDLARAVECWLAHPGEAGKVYELHDGHSGGYSWSEFIAIGERALQRRVRRLPVAAGALGLIAAGNVALARLAGRAPMLTPGKVRELRHPDWVCDNRAIGAALGWRPEINLEEGLRRTLDLDGSRYLHSGASH